MDHSIQMYTEYTFRGIRFGFAIYIAYGKPKQYLVLRESCVYIYMWKYKVLIE